MTAPPTWTPWLPPAEQDLARQAVQAIAAALPTPGAGGHGLARGEAGFALFFAELAAASAASEAHERACAHLAADSGDGDSLFGGALGGAWVATFLGSSRPAGGPLCTRLAARLNDPELPLELLDGLVGWGLGAEALGSSALAAAVRIRLTRCPLPADPGMAHGLAGAIAWVGSTTPLADPARVWLEELVNAARAALPAPEQDDLAWCAGGLGVAAALWAAGVRQGREDWCAWARVRARAAAQVPVAAAGVPDTGLCHGTAGLALLFRRLGLATEDRDLLAAADRWLEETLRRRRPGWGTGGFGRRGREGWHADPGFLAGAAGTGLVLLAALGEARPRWDRLLLLSHPEEADV